MKRQNAILRLFAFVMLLLFLAPSLMAECTLQEADQRIRDYYKAIRETFSEPKSGKSMLKWKKNVLPLIPEGLSEKNGFSFPNEPKLLFGAEPRQSLEPNRYFGLFNENRFEGKGTPEEREVLQISMDCEYSKIKPIPYPNCFYDDPAGRCIMVDYYEMNVTKTYKITNVATNAVRTYTFHDRIDVRKRDGLVASLQNEYGGGASDISSGATSSGISQEEINYEALIIAATSAWSNGEYQEAYRVYRKVIEKNPNNPPARACFHLGLMMYDQYKGRAVYKSDIDKKTAKKYAINYWKKGAQMKDERDFANQCHIAYDYLTTPD